MTELPKEMIGPQTVSEPTRGGLSWPVALVLLAALGVFLYVPSAVFFAQEGTTLFLGADFSLRLYKIFPLLGLYAFFLLWLFVFLEANLDWLVNRWQGFATVHRVFGCLALLVAVLHPGILFLAVGATQYFTFNYIDSAHLKFVLLGYLQLALLIISVAATLMHRRLGQGGWHRLRYLNYLVFGLAWVHSWNLGQEARWTWLATLWKVFIVLLVLSLLARWYRRLVASAHVSVPIT